MSDSAYLESLLAPLRASFHAKRRDRVAIADQIVRCVEAYIKTVDVEVTRGLCQAHGLPAPPPEDPPLVLATELLRLVQLLPELRSTHGPAMASVDRAGVAVAPQSSTVASQSLAGDKRSKRGLSELAEVAPPRGEWQSLAHHLAGLPLIIVGGPPHLERLGALSEVLAERLEWIDTTRQGTHAIGNLERRIRDRRIGALLILEGLVQHRHSDPLISAARSANVASTFGGKGGKAALHQALKDLDSKLNQRKNSE